jgi:hypothetical protein
MPNRLVFIPILLSKINVIFGYFWLELSKRKSPSSFLSGIRGWTITMRDGGTHILGWHSLVDGVEDSHNYFVMFTSLYVHYEKRKRFGTHMLISHIFLWLSFMESNTAMNNLVLWIPRCGKFIWRTQNLWHTNLSGGLMTASKESKKYWVTETNLKRNQGWHYYISN